MTSLPSPAQVAGKHAQLFEAFYRQLDPQNKGVISALDGATFLKRSGLSDAILSKIWDLSDPNGKGHLDKAGLFVSLKLVSLAQNGREVDINAVTSDAPEPQMGERPSLTAMNQIISNSDSDGGWSLTVAETEKFTNLFRSLEVSGKVPGVNAKNVMVESKLPVDKLGQVWDMADADKDGALDLTEFLSAMGLLARAIADGGRIPNSLPKIPQISAPHSFIPPSSTPPLIPLVPPSQPLIIQQQQQTTTILPPKPAPPPSLVGIVPPVLPPAPVITNNLLQQQPLPPPQQQLQQQNRDWIVSPEEFAKYSLLFTATDKDLDGFVSGIEIRDVFLQSGIPQLTLAHIWNLCDTDQTGKLSLEQFALAMYFINKKLTGFEPPTTLLPNMIPPSLRSSSGMLMGSINQSSLSSSSLPVETNPEFELISKEIRELALEREAIENDIMAKETEKKIKSGEMRSLQTELDTLAATLKQLENQKGVAGAKLGELAAQVDTLRTQADSQEETLKVQEGEVSEKLREYNGLNEEEQSLEHGLKETQETIEKIILNLQETQLSIGQAKAKISSLTELKENMEHLASKFSEVLETGNVYSITEPELVDLVGELQELIGEPEPEEPQQVEIVNNNSHFNSVSDSDPFASANQFAASSSIPVAFEEEDPFAALHAPPPRSASSSSPWTQPDPFLPVSGGSSSIRHDFSPGDFSKDPFGHEPFAHAVHDESPALPPKPKAGKAPPPRPAPPKNAPQRPPPPKMQSAPVQQKTFGDPFGQGDPFGNEIDHGGFADFANFEQQFNSASNTNSLSSSTTIESFSSPWGPSTISSSRTNTNKSTNESLVDTKPLDFTEDPFQNYRYEDPFALDPFSSLSLSGADPFSQSNGKASNNNTNNNNYTINNNSHRQNGL